MRKFTTPVINVKKYGGRQVAIVNGRIVASGTDAEKILAGVKRRFPKTTWREVLLVSVPKGLTVVYRI